jgi:hypothetical protein
MTSHKTGRPAMKSKNEPLTEDEAHYLDKGRFPLTNRQNLNVEDQMLIDAFNQDELTEMQEFGKPLSEKQQQIGLELHAKAELRKQMKAQRDARRAAQLQPPGDG